MIRYSLLLCVFVFFTGLVAHGQKNEREFRIKKNDFPEVALAKLEPYIKEGRRRRFYMEVDGAKSSYEVKFKKDRLYYSVEFNSEGLLEDVEFIITERDIPEDSFEQMQLYIKENFERQRIKKIQQQYPLQKSESATLREAFQNLLLPYINYEFIIASKGEKGFEEHELLFDSRGKLLRSRKSIPQKYDHVLY